MAVRLSALCTRRTSLPRNIIILMFLVLVSVRGHYFSTHYENISVSSYTRFYYTRIRISVAFCSVMESDNILSSAKAEVAAHAQ
jgi:hypothetical protein